LALASQFQYILYLLQILGGTATQNSSIQALSQTGLSPESRTQAISVSLRISLFIAVVLATLWVLSYTWLKGSIFPNDFPAWLYFLLPATCLLSSFFSWANTCLCTTKNYRLLAFHNIQQILWNMAFFIIMGYY